MSILPTNKSRRLSLGFPKLDNVFPGFELGDFAVLRGNAASFISFVMSVRSQLPHESGGLESSTVFVDGGNLFSPYSTAEIARGCGLDSKAVLDKIYVSRAFTVYQFSTLILERLYSLLRKTRSCLLIVSAVSSLFLDRDISKTDARELFIKVCSKLSEIAAQQRIIVAVTYFQEKQSKQGLFLEAILFGKCNVLIRLKQTGGIFTFMLEDHLYIKPFTVNFMADQSPAIREV